MKKLTRKILKACIQDWFNQPTAEDEAKLKEIRECALYEYLRRQADKGEQDKNKKHSI